MERFLENTVDNQKITTNRKKEGVSPGIEPGSKV